MYIPNETWWKFSSLEPIIFTKFHEHWTKIVYFLLMAKFWTCLFSLLRPYSYVLHEFWNVNVFAGISLYAINGFFAKISFLCILEFFAFFWWFFDFLFAFNWISYGFLKLYWLWHVEGRMLQEDKIAGQIEERKKEGKNTQ